MTRPIYRPIRVDREWNEGDSFGKFVALHVARSLSCLAPVDGSANLVKRVRASESTSADVDKDRGAFNPIIYTNVCTGFLVVLGCAWEPRCLCGRLGGFGVVRRRVDRPCLDLFLNDRK